MKGANTIFSSRTDEYTTPDDLFSQLNNEFAFTLDPCATDGNHKCQKYFTSAENGLDQDWGGIECSAIHHTVTLLIGCVNAIRKALKTERLWLC